MASLGHRVVAWSLSGKRSDYWRVHSSLSLAEDQHVTALNCTSGMYMYMICFVCLTSPRPARGRNAVWSVCVHSNPRERPAHMVLKVVVHVCTTHKHRCMYIYLIIKQCPHPVPCAILSVSHVYCHYFSGAFNQSELLHHGCKSHIACSTTMLFARI